MSRVNGIYFYCSKNDFPFWRDLFNLCAIKSCKRVKTKQVHLQPNARSWNSASAILGFLAFQKVLFFSHMNIHIHIKVLLLSHFCQLVPVDFNYNICVKAVLLKFHSFPFQQHLHPPNSQYIWIFIFISLYSLIHNLRDYIQNYFKNLD